MKPSDTGYRTGLMYESLVKWPFACYLTTNYDNEIQESLKKQREYFAVRGNADADLAQIRDSVEKLIVKLHSDFANPEHIVLTSKDYEKLRIGNEGYGFREHLKRIFNTFDILIVGHGMNDPDLELLLATAKSVASPLRPIFFIAPDLSEGEKRELTEQYNIRTISYPNGDGTHVRLREMLASSEKFIASRGNCRPIDNVSSSELADAATAIFTYRILSSTSQGDIDAINTILSPLILRALARG